MKTLLLLSVLATLPAFADSGSPSGSYPPSYYHQETPDSGSSRQAPDVAAQPRNPEPGVQGLSD
jgi:hypothetical protein